MSNADMTSPVDLPPPDGEEPHPLLWASTAIVVATGFLLLFNASALRGWAFELEPSSQNERVVAVADGWYQKTEILYLDRPVAAMSSWWLAVKALEFGSADEAADREIGPDPVAVEEGTSRSATDDAEGPGFSLQ
ncbi:hypothetical protein [Parasphingopyxis lamellibrachiae]|uniref:Uncharacterized protein n=1 Tax=Parasphingopyxis lamellibrachiae TaxID=680125 RepID=A0A3D9FFE3_9SPHN|nr:hypothetical protein [Parasphingopyxis lamellibrachiae]RED16535.1 hypothetical protein DFR46_1559 [Parasphingopyxis lamellibrachiae]